MSSGLGNAPGGVVVRQDYRAGVAQESGFENRTGRTVDHVHLTDGGDVDPDETCVRVQIEGHEVLPVRIADCTAE